MKKIGFTVAGLLMVTAIALGHPKAEKHLEKAPMKERCKKMIAALDEMQSKTTAGDKAVQDLQRLVKASTGPQKTEAIENLLADSAWPMPSGPVLVWG